MRVSCYRDDPGFRHFNMAMANGKTIRVYLDGEEVQACTVADDDAGFIKRHVLDAQGKPQLDPNDPECVWEERAEGKVEIVFDAND